MRALLYFLVGLIALAIATYSALYFLSPSTLVEAGISHERKQAGLELKQITVADHDIHYLTGGPENAPVLLMLHGYAANKDNWVRFAAQFSDRYRVLIPDLPGFGDSSRLTEQSYDINSQVERLQAFVDALKLPRFHLLGNSMGGMLSAAYSLEHPDKVLSLGLLNSAGVKEPELSPRSKAWAEGRNILLLESSEDLDRLFALAFNHPPAMPQIAKDYVAQKALEQKDFNEKVARDLTKQPYELDDKLGQIHTSSLVIWGDSDRIIDVSSAQVFEQGLPESTTIIMEDTGHLPMLERPKKTAKHYQQFLRTVTGKE